MPGVAIFPADPGRGTGARARGAARRATATGTQEPGRPLPDPTPGARQSRPPAPPRPRTPSHRRPGTGRPRRPEAAGDTGAGQMPGLRRRPGARSALARSSARAWRRRRGRRGPAGPAPTRHPAGQPPRGLRREEETGRAAAGGGGDLEEGAGAAEPPLPGCAARGARGVATSFPRSQAPPRAAAFPQPRGRRGRLLRGSQPVPTPAAGSPELRPAGGKPRVPRVPEKTGPWSPSVCRAHADLPSLCTCIIACAGPKWLFPKKSGKLTSRSLPTMASAPETCVMKSRGIRYPLPRPFLPNSHKHNCYCLRLTDYVPGTVPHSTPSVYVDRTHFISQLV